MNGFIYKIINNQNDKVYIGKTLSSIQHRFAEHCKDSKKETKEIRPLYRAMNKYGIHNFTIELVEEVEISQLSEREQYWIAYYNSYHNGYNATLGGEGKQLYDYNAILESYLSGKLMKDLAIEFECSIDTIQAALHLAGVNTMVNANKKSSKGIIAKTLSGETIQQFISRTEAAQWLRDNGYTKSDNIDNIIATIGRVANGKRASAYGLKWENCSQ